MDISIVIVSYNAADFLRLCLNSVKEACSHISSEIFVVDNNSQDHSVVMVQEEFPEVRLIANKHNPGFAIANNQAIKMSKGRYVLILNPDTIVAEDTFVRVVDFMDQHTDAGGVGVRMLDGTGAFLPESKRGLPSPWTSLCKMVGLSSLFPHSKSFSEYHKGYLNPNQNHQIEILAGAFMCLKKNVLDKVGLLDEDFFMYGEDIDLSYRIVLSGYSNYYLAHPSIIHFKGESTYKDSIYRDRFYKAMIQFAEKHFNKGYGLLLKWFIYLGVYLARLASSVSISKHEIADNDENDSKAFILGSCSRKLNYPMPIEEVLEADLETVTGGVLIFVTGQISFKRIIEIMFKFQRKFKYRFFDEKANILIGSDSKWVKGTVTAV